MQNLIIYTKQSGGILTRHVLRGVTKMQHKLRYRPIMPGAPTPQVEKLIGWTESAVEWINETWGYGIE